MQTRKYVGLFHAKRVKMGLFVPAILVMLVLFSGCSRLTLENYEKIKMGMEYGEVAGILGQPDSCTEALFARSCIWGSERKNITVNFVGGKAILFTSKNIR